MWPSFGMGAFCIKKLKDKTFIAYSRFSFDGQIHGDKERALLNGQNYINIIWNV